MIDSDLLQYIIRIGKILTNHQVDFIVVGGAAVSHYGYNRPSGIGSYRSSLKVDLDFWYRPTVANYHKLLRALDELDVDTMDLKQLVFDKHRTFLKIPHPNFHTDFLPVMEGLPSFSVCKKRAESLQLDKTTTLKILSLDDLLLNKRSVDRKTDRLDIDALNKIRKDRRGE